LVIPSRDELNASGGWVVPTPPRLLREPASNGTADETAPSYRRPLDQPNEVADPGGDAASIERMETRFERLNEPARPRPAAIVHVVGPDETPRSIARDRLGNPRRASEIIELNQDRLAAEGRWRPGLRILLPSDAAPQPEPE